jgi:PEGA domain
VGLKQRRALSSVFAGLLASFLFEGSAHAQLAPMSVPATGAGQGRPSVALLVVPAGGPSGDAVARIRREASQAIERAGQFELISSIDALDPQNARARELRFAEGSASLERAHSAYNDLDMALSLSQAEQAITAFAESDLTAHWKDLTAAWILKIASLVANGTYRAAEEEITQLIAADPSVQFSPDFFPPEFIASAERRRQEAANATETLEVRTVPAGAEVYVDGRFRGISPAKVESLAPGAHYVTVKAAGYVLAQQKVPTGVVDIELRPAESSSRYVAALDRIARNPDAKARDEAVREYGAFVGVDQVLLVILDVKSNPQHARLVGLRLDPKDGHNLAYKVKVVPLNRAVEGAEPLVAALMGSDEARRGGPVTHYGREFFGDGIRKPAGWALLGLGLVAAGVGAISGARAGATHATWRSTPQTDPSSDSLEASFRRQATVANLGFLGGLLFAGGGGYLAFAGGSSGDTP